MGSEIFAEKQGIKARKNHFCFWCPELIPKGTRYDAWTWADGGDITRVKVHPECREAWAEASANEPGALYETEAHEHARGSTGPI